jgi:hypothetical protein
MMQLEDLVVFFLGEKVTARHNLIAIVIWFHAGDVGAVSKFVGMLAQDKLNVAQGFTWTVHFFFFGRPPFLPLMRADCALRGVLMDPNNAAALMGL